jgi:hypothetical protein
MTTLRCGRVPVPLIRALIFNGGIERATDVRQPTRHIDPERAAIRLDTGPAHHRATNAPASVASRK